MSSAFLPANRRRRAVVRRASASDESQVAESVRVSGIAEIAESRSRSGRRKRMRERYVVRMQLIRSIKNVGLRMVDHQSKTAIRPKFC